MSDTLSYLSAAGTVVAIVTGVVALGRANSKSRQAAIEKGRGQGVRDAEVSSLRATVDCHNDKIGELDEWRQETRAQLAKLTTDNNWIKETLSDLKEGVDELRRRG